MSARRLRSCRAALLVGLLICLPALAAAAGHSLLHVFTPSQTDADALLSLPGLDIALYKPGSHAEIVATGTDIERIRAAGFRLEIAIPDLETHYAERIAATSRAKDGNFGIFHTYSEVVDWLDELHALYPSCISAKWSIGQSHEGRDLWCIRVSDNPGVDEIGEPEILIDGMHHAREIMASEVPMMLAEYLGARYGSDPAITWLLDNREIYIVPVVNPDGVVYNELTDPNGGGMWRKNRRVNGGGSYGVDPNRNYPYEWGGSGSSSDPDDITYHGPSPASEPEVQALMALIDAHEFVTGQSFHSYSNVTLIPWGYTSTPCPHDDVFQHMGERMCRYNGYGWGTAWDMINYVVSGGTIDWFYGDTTDHPLCYSVSNEIGSSADGFWPDESRRQALFEDNLWPCLYQIMAAGTYIEVRDTEVVGGDGDALLDPGENAAIGFVMENFGLVDGASSPAVTLRTDDPYLQILEGRRELGDFLPMEVRDLSGSPVPVAVHPSCPDSRLLGLTINAEWAGGESDWYQELATGEPVPVSLDDMESGTGGWTLTDGWAITSASAHSPTHSLTDSPSGNYSNSSTPTATMDAMALPGGAKLEFWHRYEIEEDWDYGYVQVSTDGSSWSTVETFTGNQTAWTKASVDLSQWGGQTAQIRFRLETDSWVTDDGWYVDDVAILGHGDENLTPETPLPVSPAPDAMVSPTPELAVANSVDPEGTDPVTYGFRIYGDADCTDLVASVEGVAETAGQTGWTVPSGLLTPGLEYWWRAFAADDAAWGLMGETRRMTVDSLADVFVGGRGLGLEILDPSGSTTVRFALTTPAAGDLDVAVYNARGQMMKRLSSEHRTAGRHLLAWDGYDDSGRPAPSGVYFLDARQADHRTTGRLLLVR